MVVATGCGGPQDPVVMRYGSTVVGVEELIDEALGNRYQGLSPEQKVDFALRQKLMTAHLTTEPATDDELEILRRKTARVASQRCLAVKLKQRIAASPIDIEAESKSYFEAHREEFSVPDRFVLDLIFIPVEDEGSEALVRDVLAQTERDPERFAELARRHSRSETAATGGRTQPIPGTAVHPEVRRAVVQNRSSDRPFMVTIDRGHYILRVVEFWPEVSGELDDVRPQVVEAVRRQVMDRFFQEAAEQVLGGSEVEIRRDLFLAPRVDAMERVVSVDGQWFTVRDVYPTMPVGATVAGPQLRGEFVGFHRWLVSSEFFDCPEPSDLVIEDGDLASSRLDKILVEYASESLKDEILRYHLVHRTALETAPEFTFDLYVFPIGESGPYAEHTRFRGVMESLQKGENVDTGQLENTGVAVFADVVMTDVDAARYDRVLAGALAKLNEGGISKPVTAAGSPAWLMVRLDNKTEPRPLNPDDPGDFTVIAAQYVADSRERVVESMYDETRRQAIVDDALLAQCVDAVRHDAETLHDN